MPQSWALMNNHRALSGFERDEFLDDATIAFHETLEVSPLGVNVILFKDSDLDESKALHTKAVVQGNTPSSRTAYGMRQILSRLDTLKIGNYVKFDGDFYLITEIPGNNQIYDQALMRLCNYDLRWVNHLGSIVERKGVYWDHTVHLAGETTNRYIVTGNMRSQFYLPKDSETMRISRDQRFMIDDFDHAQVSTPVVYKVGKLNLVEKSKEGAAAYILTLVEDNFNETTDNRRLMIADYFPSVYTFEIITPSNLEVKLGQSVNIQFDAKVNGVETKENVQFVTDNKDVLSVNDDGVIEALSIGNGVVKVQFFDIEKEININVVSANRVFQDVVNISFVGEPNLRVGGTKSFTANFFGGNGEPMSDTANWIIRDDNGNVNPSFITATKKNNNVLQIKCRNDISLLGRQVTLSVIGSSGMVSGSVTVNLVSLT